VIVMSDGYDTDPPEALAVQLRRLKRRVHHLVWLNPLLGGRVTHWWGASWLSRSTLPTSTSFPNF
jgi:uncharacterized protein with von Willebrand factor type A (vWA) domain